MPCFSKIQTVLIDIEIVKKAASALGITVERHTENLYTLRKGSEHIQISRTKPGEKFSTTQYNGSDDWINQILTPLVQTYAKEQLKVFAKKNGYTLSASGKQNEYVLTSYK